MQRIIRFVQTCIQFFLDNSQATWKCAHMYQLHIFPPPPHTHIQLYMDDAKQLMNINKLYVQVGEVTAGECVWHVSSVLWASQHSRVYCSSLKHKTTKQLQHFSTGWEDTMKNFWLCGLHFYCNFDNGFQHLLMMFSSVNTHTHTHTHTHRVICSYLCQTWATVVWTCWMSFMCSA